MKKHRMDDARNEKAKAGNEEEWRGLAEILIQRRKCGRATQASCCVIARGAACLDDARAASERYVCVYSARRSRKSLDYVSRGGIIALRARPLCEHGRRMAFLCPTPLTIGVIVLLYAGGSVYSTLAGSADAFIF